MLKDGILERYLEALLHGDRKRCRAVIEETLQSGVPANSVYADIIWPIMVEIEQLLRSDRITTVEEHLATRINRTIVDQLPQIMADLFESDGWEVRFLGGGLTNDDILAYINEYAPDILLIYGTAPKQAPDVRRLIDTIRAVNAWPQMRIMLSGGVFGRAEGLWQEIGADLFAESAVKALQVAWDDSPIEREPMSMDHRRRKRRKLNEDLPVQVP